MLDTSGDDNNDEIRLVALKVRFLRERMNKQSYARGVGVGVRVGQQFCPDGLTVLPGWVCSFARVGLQFCPV